jgi:AcrR family transcriptional regulator
MKMTQNERSSEDLRVKRTHKLILDAMIELTAQRGFSKLTVRDITKYAGINRATFYRHYVDKFDLLNQYAETVYNLPDAPLEGKIRRSRRGNDKRIDPGMATVFEHVGANAKFFLVMLGKNGDPAFSEKIRQFIQKRLRGSLPAQLTSRKIHLELYLNYVSSASLGALIWWLEHEMPYSPADLEVIFQRLNAAVFRTMFAEDPPL